MNFFSPKKEIFFDLFKDGSAILNEMVALFVEFGKNFNDFENYARRAKDIEHKGDMKIHEIIALLNKTFITPFDREDIYLLAHELDDIIDLIENVIRNVYLYRMTKKINAWESFTPLIQEAAENLENLLEHFRKQKYTAELKDAVVKIHELEDKGDAVFGESISRLFSEERDPIEVVKKKDILEGLENILDKCQRVSDIIEGIVVKSG